MEIKGISNSNYFVKPNPVNKSDVSSSTESKDKIEISTAAKEIAKSELGSARLEEIRAKMQNKFYDSPEVLDKVASKVLIDIKK
ncbi:MAG: hypothetical protein RBS48_10140 [Ignavibacteriaceae bacterium]|mgnify:CR=1 FL=1|nr:hypothetical protein [Ignavibacteriaceae bacterium]